MRMEKFMYKEKQVAQLQKMQKENQSGTFFRPAIEEDRIAFQTAAQAFPLVYIVVTELGGLALIVDATKDEVIPLWLPELTESGLRSQLVGTDAASAASSYLGAYNDWQQNQQNQ